MNELASHLVEHLDAIIRQWDRLLDPATAVGGERVKASKDAPLPISVDVLSLRREACEQLGSWVHLIYEERELSTTGHDLGDAKASAAFIARHADWMAHHEAGPACLAEVAAIEGRVTVLVTGAHVRRFVVGPCPETTTQDDGPAVACAGELFAIIRATDSLLPSELRCSAHPDHTWAAHAWRTLVGRIPIPANPTATRRLLGKIAG